MGKQVNKFTLSLALVLSGTPMPVGLWMAKSWMRRNASPRPLSNHFEKQVCCIALASDLKVGTLG